MRLTARQKIATTFVAATGISIVIGALAYSSASRMRNAAVLVAHQQRVVSALDSIFPADTAMLIAERAYVLTGDDVYLKTHDQAVASARAAIRRARELTADDPSQERRMALVSGLDDRLETISARIMRERRARGGPSAAEQELMGTASRLQHAVSVIVTGILTSEHRRLADRQLQMTGASKTALDLILAGSALAVLIGLVASVRIRDDFRSLEQAEGRFRALMDSAPDAMVVVDGEGNIVLVNERTEALFDYRREELIGKAIEVLVPERYRARHAAHRGGYDQAPVLRPMGTSLELFARRRDGSEIPVEVTLSPVATAGGLQVVSAIRDISDRKRVLEQLREARGAAEKADRAKSIFLATASHDLRQPLQAISLLNGTLCRMGKDSDPGEALSQQEAAINVMSRLLNALLDISKLESGAVKPVLTSWQVFTVFDPLRTEFAKIAADKGVSLEVEGSPAWIHSDVELVGQVLRNLVSNAIKYTHRGSVRVRVGTGDERLRIEVTDTGIGMAPQELDHIYEEFYQIGVPTNATRGGYGLGLTIVSRIIKLLNLKLDVRSEPGKGSTFALTLPAGTPTVAPTDHLDVRPAAQQISRSAHRVLIVDDEPAVLSATRLLLKAEGYAVVTASSVAQAIERLRESNDLELVITDYHLADGEDGRQVIACARQIHGPDFKGVLVTGDTSAAARGKDGEATLRFLSKPVDPDRLLMLLQELLAPPAQAAGGSQNDS